MKIEKGLFLGFFDNNDIELCLGDRVKVVKTSYYMNVDGWGRDLPTERVTGSETKNYTGEIVYDSNLCKFQVSIPKWTCFDLFYFDKIEKIIDK